MKRLILALLFVLAPLQLYGQLGRTHEFWDSKWSQDAGHHKSVVRILCGGEGSTFWGGSGVLVEGDLFYTAAHVIDGSLTIKVIFQDGKAFEVSIKECFVSRDVAVLKPNGKIPEEYLRAKVFGGSLKVGDKLEACGMAGDEGLRHFTGAVRGYDDSRVVLDGYAIQGDSGGPIFNSAGEVVSIISGGVLWHDGGIISAKGKRQVTTPIIGPRVKVSRAVK